MKFSKEKLLCIQMHVNDQNSEFSINSYLQEVAEMWVKFSTKIGVLETFRQIVI